MRRNNEFDHIKFEGFNSPTKTIAQLNMGFKKDHCN